MVSVGTYDVHGMCVACAWHVCAVCVEVRGQHWDIGFLLLVLHWFWGQTRVIRLTRPALYSLSHLTSSAAIYFYFSIHDDGFCLAFSHTGDGKTWCLDERGLSKGAMLATLITISSK